MIVRWDNPSQTYVRVIDGDSVRQIPKDPHHPEWQQIEQAVAAQTLVIEPYLIPEAPKETQP